MVSGFDLFRVWYGPLSPEFCQLCLLLKGTVTYAMPIIIAGIVILKFLYICVWQGFRQMNDDLVVRIIIILACFCGFYMQLTKNIVTTYNTVFFTRSTVQALMKWTKKFQLKWEYLSLF